MPVADNSTRCCVGWRIPIALHDQPEETMRAAIRRRVARGAIAVLAGVLPVLMATTPAHAASNHILLYSDDYPTGAILDGDVTWGPGCGQITVDVEVGDIDDDRYDAIGWAYVHRCDGSYYWSYIARTVGYGDFQPAIRRYQATGLYVYVCVIGDWHDTSIQNSVYCSNKDHA
jgi:hypothetical protein